VTTLVAIVVGLVLLTAINGLACRRGAAARVKATTAFLVFWLVLCVVDAVLGVVAGNPVGNQVVTRGLVFLVVAVCGYLLARRHPAAPDD
jgi:putative effector of murein hydrolase LrgA (UPF0299 family)